MQTKESFIGRHFGIRSMIHNLTCRLWSLHSDTFCSLFKLLQTLKGKYNKLKEAMDTLTKSSVDLSVEATYDFGLPPSCRVQ